MFQFLAQNVLQYLSLVTLFSAILHGHTVDDLSTIFVERKKRTESCKRKLLKYGGSKKWTFFAFQKELDPDKGKAQIFSVTRLGDFYKFLGTNCLKKVAQIIWWLFGLFLIMSLLCKTLRLLFVQFLGKIGLLFSPTSGHIVYKFQRM